jgi:hypothetical protein
MKLTESIARLCEWEMNGYKPLASTRAIRALCLNEQHKPSMPRAPFSTAIPLALSKAVDADFDRLIEIRFAVFGQRHATPPASPISTCCTRVAIRRQVKQVARDRNLKALHTDPTVTGGEAFVESTPFG